MSTFNGERFLPEQIDSILAQKKIDVFIVVRDDGSSDGTLSMLEEYNRKYKGKFHIIAGENKGWKRSFLELISYAASHLPDFDFYAFADQDDIWLPEKLEKASSSLSPFTGKPALYCSNLFFYKDGQNLGPVRQSSVVPTHKNCLCRNYATGCTEVFNNAMARLLGKETPGIDIAHDYWAYMVACVCGNIVVDDNAYILYRQHATNQIGHKTSLADVWKRRVRSFRKSLQTHNRESVAKELIRIYKDSMTPEALSAVSKIADYRHSPKSRFSLLLDRGYTLGNPANDLILRLRVILGVL